MIEIESNPFAEFQNITFIEYLFVCLEIGSFDPTLVIFCIKLMMMRNAY